MPVSAELERAVSRFLFTEARLLDANSWDEWLALYAGDAIYWVPGSPGQIDPLNAVSIIYEDREVLLMRVRRLEHVRAYSLDPPVRTAHTLANIEVDEEPDGTLVAHSVLTVVSFRPEEERRVFAGRATHRLLRSGESFLIRHKRVDLIDCDGIHPGLIAIPF